MPPDTCHLQFLTTVQKTMHVVRHQHALPRADSTHTPPTAAAVRCLYFKCATDWLLVLQVRH
jgi:hypothetical protein